MCRKGGEAFKRRLVHGFALIIMALNNFVLLLKSFIANVLKCKAHLKSKFKRYYVFLSDESIKTESEYQQCFSIHTVPGF